MHHKSEKLCFAWVRFLDAFIMLWLSLLFNSCLDKLLLFKEAIVRKEDLEQKDSFPRSLSSITDSKSSVHQWGKDLQFISSTRLLVLAFTALVESI